MLLEVMAYWLPEGVDPEQEETLKRKIKCILEPLVVNTGHIVAIHQHSETKEAMIRLTNGDVFQITEKYEVFKEILLGEQVARDMLVSGDN